MKGRSLLPLLCSVIFSCDPGVYVSLQNQSSQKRKVEILYREDVSGRTLPDHVSIMENKNQRVQLPVAYKDPVNKRFGFDIDTAQKIVTWTGIGFYFHPFILIVENKDTVHLSPKSRDIEKRSGWMSTEWMYTIR